MDKKMNFEKLGKPVSPVEEKSTEKKEEKPLNLQEISGEIEELQAKTSNFFDIEKLRYKKGIDLSHKITKCLMETGEKEAGNFWNNLENSFSNKNEFFKFQSWILSTTAAMKILKENGFKVYSAPTELDLKNGIDIIAAKMGTIFGIQLKAIDLASLKTNKTKIGDLVSEPIGRYRNVMEKGINKLKEMCNKRRKIPFKNIKLLMMTIPTGKEILTDNGDFGKQFNKKSFLEVLNNSMIP